MSCSSPEASAPQIDGDLQRPPACTAMAHLLAGGDDHNNAVLTHLAPGLNPAVVVAPEYAFGHADWAELDALVRHQNRPLVLIAGFGATAAGTVETWAQGAGDTARRLSWNPQAAQLSPVRPVNGAWCWIHGFGLDTTCVVFLKNHMEQGTELVALEWIQSGSHLLRVSFEDLDLFPLICADMVQTFADGDGTAVCIAYAPRCKMPPSQPNQCSSPVPFYRAFRATQTGLSPSTIGSTRPR